MNRPRVCAVIPAAGRGTRLGLEVPKILAELAEGVTVWHQLSGALRPWVDHLHVIVSPAGESRFRTLAAREVEDGVVSVSVQHEPAGMGAAVFGAARHWQAYGAALVAWGDQVNLSSRTVREVVQAHARANAPGRPGLTLPLVPMAQPYVEYEVEGDRLVRVRQSREGEACRPGGLGDLGLFCLGTEGLVAAWTRYLAQAAGGTVTGEVNFLPFLPYLSQVHGWPMRVVPVSDPDEARGINTQDDLEFARQVFRRRSRARPPLRRVYAVCTEVPPGVVGGLGRYAERLMAAWADLETPLEVFGAAGPGAAPRTERAGGVTLHRVRTLGAAFDSSSRLPRALQPALRIAGLVAFNIVVAARILLGAGRSSSVVAVHDWMGCLAGILCRVLGRMPVVFHVHTREESATASKRRSPVAAAITALEAVQARLARRVVIASAGMFADLASCGWKPDRLRIVPHGCEDRELLRLAGLPDAERDRLRAELRRRYLPGGEGALVVFAGRFSPHKGVGTLIQATALLARTHRRLRVVLVGAQAPRTRDDAAVAGRIEQEGVGPWVHAEFRFREPGEVYAHYLAADVCVFPSTYEPFGLAAVEAMTLARPVVVGPGFSPEVVGDGAIRCAHDSPEELAAALLRCIDDPQAAARLGERGAAYVRQRYSWARTAELTLAAYAEAAE